MELSKTSCLSFLVPSSATSGEVLLTLQSPELRTWEFVLLSAFIRPLPTSPSSTSITTRSARAIRPSPPTPEITIGRWTAGKESCPTFVYAAFSFILSFNFPPPRQYSLKQFCTAKCYPRKLLSLNSRQQCNAVHTPHSAVLSRSVVSHSVSCVTRGERRCGYSLSCISREKRFPLYGFPLSFPFFTSLPTPLTFRSDFLLYLFSLSLLLARCSWRVRSFTSFLCSRLSVSLPFTQCGSLLKVKRNDDSSHFFSRKTCSRGLQTLRCLSMIMGSPRKNHFVAGLFDGGKNVRCCGETTQRVKMMRIELSCESSWYHHEDAVKTTGVSI
ncbi:hypothetical protein ACFE04_019795 [Oxalis oulophora]